MKSILVPIEPNELIASTVETGWLLGKAFAGYVEGFALSPALSPFVAADAIGVPMLYEPDARQSDQAVRESRRAFEEAMTAHGASPAPGTGGVTFGWFEGPSQSELFLGARGRVFDVTVVGQPGSKPASPRMSTLEAALFDSGRPILIAPPVVPCSLGEVVAIAWNRSTESARAVALAMPLLKRAKRIVVVSVDGGGIAGPTGEELARYLERNGVVCEVTHVRQLEAKLTGSEILDAAAKIGSDLLIKGAFTQSRLRQIIFGGATRHIIAEAKLPVLMAH